jgi:acetyl-CoA carboxylase biotin carboxyl carrier protein
MLQDKIKSLIKIIEGTEVDELEVSSFWGAQKIRLRKNNNVEVQTLVQPQQKAQPVAQPNITETTAPTVEPVKVTEPEATEINTPENTIEVIAPLVGTYYQSPKPGSPPFVKEGDVISVGQTLCIIEAMKIFNEIESEVSGKIIKIVAQDSSPVEYGQALMLVKPN